MSTGSTVFEVLLASIHHAADYNRDDVVPPTAILWPDEKREWERLLPRLRLAMPHLLTFGPYDPTTRTGPAIWLRCVLAGKLPDLLQPPDAIPILYLPGVSRLTLRATDECPPELRPLAELQYRGAFWSQHNGKDWTISAFLQSEKGGLNLRLARDTATQEAIRRAVEKLADVPVGDLEAKSATRSLDGHDFDALLVDDPVDDLLSWLADPKGVRARWQSEPGRWEALRSRCKNDYTFDPDKDGELVAAELLGLCAKPAWKNAWKRFATAPARYAGIVDLLRKAKPRPKVGDLLGKLAVEFWPQDNEAEEASLRQSLHDLTSLPVPSARDRLRDLDVLHEPRREWVWAKLGQAPLTDALRHLKTLADATDAPRKGATTEDVIRTYTTQGWATDLAVLDALAAVSTQDDRAAVVAAVQHVYTPWLRDLAEQFQECVKQTPLPGREVARLKEVSPGTCVFFADGLRYDLGQRLKGLLEAKGLVVQIHHHTAALPTVTPTAKPAISPVASKIAGLTAGEEFRPSVAQDQKDLTVDRFRKLLDEGGIQILGGGETGKPDGRGWTESGNLDQSGHQEGLNLSRRVPEHLNGFVERISGLLEAGWQEVRVVTDHGWLLVPGGLPKADLPKYLTATRWGRCAVVKPSATVDYPSYAWFWSEDVRVASPCGIDCFVAGKEY
ncbi:MAG TPA: BREX-1 system phosphatase PglZ type B, partial [Isosphaeraceae bacterium]|nr:BREX-1 system phosphatase PglZ type B [Isosphaeraceae bacterium]